MKMLTHMRGTIGKITLKKYLFRALPIAIGCLVTVLLLLWAWYQIKAIVFGAAGIAILIGAYALKKRLS